MQWDIKGNAHGLLSTHPVAPFVSIHHVEAIDPFYPGLSSIESLQLFTQAMKADPGSLLQRSICYDPVERLTFQVSLGYVVQVFPNIVLPRELERAEQTYSAWNGISHRNEFDFDTRDPERSICKKPILFFLKDVGREGNNTLGLYERFKAKDDLKRKVFCFPRLPPLSHVQNIQVLGYPLSKKWHMVCLSTLFLSSNASVISFVNHFFSYFFLTCLNVLEQVPRRLCCKLNNTTDDILRITVGQCEKRAFSSI